MGTPPHPSPEERNWLTGGWNIFLGVFVLLLLCTIFIAILKNITKTL